VSLIIGSAGASDYTLEIFGNANMDGTIDEKDIAYVEGIIKGANAATNLSDANYDGIIDPLDVEQVEKIISGEETKLVLLDSASKIVTIKMPVEKIIPLNRNAAEALKTIKASDRIVGVSDAAIREKSYFPEFQEIQCVVSA
jgi:iron complex transport system substrate-binding protein